MEKMEMTERMKEMERIFALKPEGLIGNDVNWKLLVRLALKGQTTLITGFRGSGKTLLVESVANALQRPLFKFDFGATQDARSSLIGNAHFDKETGKYLSKSEFVRAVQTEGAIIMLDNYQRSAQEARNIVFHALGKRNRHLRINESESSDEVIEVANGVTFFLICSRDCNAYTASQISYSYEVIHFCACIEIEPLGKQEITTLLKLRKGLSEKDIDIISAIYSEILEEFKKHKELYKPISVRHIKFLAELIEDGVPIQEAIESVVLPLFSNVHGLDSDRAYVKKAIDKVISNT